jgi:hypothetical protein
MQADRSRFQVNGVTVSAIRHVARGDKQMNAADATIGRNPQRNFLSRAQRMGRSYQLPAWLLAWPLA